MQALVDALGRDGAALIVTDTAPHSGADARQWQRPAQRVRSSAVASSSAG